MAQGDCNPSERRGLDVTPSDPEIYEAVGDWLKAILPEHYAVIRAQLNRIPAPAGPFAQMLIVSRRRYATNSRTLTREGMSIVTQPMLMTMQLSFYRDGAGEAASLISSLWRDEAAPEWFNRRLPSIAPVKTSEPYQNAWIDGAAQYVDGWHVDLTLDVQSRTALPTQTALDLRSDLMAADVVTENKE